MLTLNQLLLDSVYTLCPYSDRKTNTSWGRFLERTLVGGK